jgi:hypothetical protein
MGDERMRKKVDTRGDFSELNGKLKIAVTALEAIKKKDGPGCDLSPAGECYDIAKQALDKITS